MATFIVGLDDPGATDRRLVGGKGAALARGRRLGFVVPPTLTITTEAYLRFVDEGKLAGAITMEIDRKDFADMRWEELWDAALRLRNRFLNAPVPSELRDELAHALRGFRPGATLAVRSSSVAEDSGGASFAGLHESYINVAIDPVENVLDHVKLVWASLWSDRALLYRRELGLDVVSSAMAVVVQELVTGDASGIMFTRAPDDTEHLMIEAVYGLNQGLVDGSVSPDRWILERTGGTIIRHVAPEERLHLTSQAPGVLTVEAVPGDLATQAPLEDPQVLGLGSLGMDLEDSFGAPQDVEWTYAAMGPVLLQCRPITAGSGGDDERAWYLTLHRSIENLQALRHRVEEELIPAMDTDAARHGDRDLSTLTDDALEAEIRGREGLLARWEAAYREDCIPLAHGVRLFGTVYNDTVRPDDPFEFVQLLAGTSMESLARNRDLEELAALHVHHEERPSAKAQADLEKRLGRFLADHGETVFGGLSADTREEALSSLVRRYAAREKRGSDALSGDREGLQKNFLQSFPRGPAEAEGLLDLARASYRLRDDDNIHLGKIRSVLLDALAERSRRRGGVPEPGPDGKTDPNYPARALFAPGTPPLPGDPRSRQIVGQPASRGIGHGPARIVTSPADLQRFQAGEILVCDAIDPTMTYVCPLAAGIVERRGGMLIHGAIIAREYGIPCVTGVPGAVERIRTGDRVTVDGFLGIVVVQRSEP